MSPVLERRNVEPRTSNLEPRTSNRERSNREPRTTNPNDERSAKPSERRTPNGSLHVLESILNAAFLPDAPMIPPPGCVADPHIHRFRIGVRYCAQPGTG